MFVAVATPSPSSLSRLPPFSVSLSLSVCVCLLPLACTEWMLLLGVVVCGFVAMLCKEQGVTVFGVCLISDAVLSLHWFFHSNVSVTPPASLTVLCLALIFFWLPPPTLLPFLYTITLTLTLTHR